MHFVLILATAALTLCVRAAPQFTNLNLGNLGLQDILSQVRSPGHNENRNQNNGLRQHAFPFQLMTTQHRRWNDNGQQIQQNLQGLMCPCPNPARNNLLRQYLPQFTNGHFPAQNNFNLHMNPHHNDGSQWGGGQRPHHGPQHHHGHGGPPHHHGHGGPPHHHGNGGPPHHHGNGGPPHHHGNGGPPYHHGNGGPPYRPHDGDVNGLEVVGDNSNGNVISENPTTSMVQSTTPSVVYVPSSSSAPLIISSVDPVHNEEGGDGVTQNSIDNSIKSTTEFDWNNYFVGASADNTGGEGSIDIRSGGLAAV